MRKASSTSGEARGSLPQSYQCDRDPRIPPVGMRAKRETIWVSSSTMTGFCF